jgi:DNA-binding GntR family transcriptional regulator
MTPHPAPAWPTTLATQVYRRLRGDLIEGIMPPGIKLKIQVLAAEKF